MSTGRRITMSQYNKMKALHDKGISKLQVAKILGLSSQSIYKHLKGHVPEIPSGNEASVQLQSKNKVIEAIEDLVPKHKPIKLQEKRRENYSLPSSEEDHDYVLELARKHDLPMRIIIRQIIAKHKKRWWQF